MKKHLLVAAFLTVVLGAGYWAWIEKTKAGAPPPQMADDPGVRAFFAHTCNKCHAVAGVGGADGTLGPPLDDIGNLAGKRVEGLSAREYLIQSLRQPAAHQVRGFMNVMPAYELEPTEEEALVQWLTSLRR